LSGPEAQPATGPVADVVIPTFNDGPRLARAVASALALPCIARVIVVDDGSTPPARLDDALLTDRVTLLRQANAGPSAARNAALDCVRSPFAVFLDADDTLLPDVAVALRFSAQGGYAAVVSARVDVASDGSERPKSVPPEWADRALPSAEDVWRPIWLFGMPGVVLAKRVIETGLRFDLSLKGPEDREFLHRVAAIGPIGVCSARVVRYTLPSEGSLTGSRNFPRMCADVLRLLDTRHTPAGHDHWQSAINWYAGVLARRRPQTAVERGLWQSMTATCAKHGLSLPLKARLRMALGRLTPR
jgi:glycosyltransferase involved in cell wall biosynthesis